MNLPPCTTPSTTVHPKRSLWQGRDRLHAFSACAGKKTRAALRRIVAAHAFVQMQWNRHGFRCVTAIGNNDAGMSIGLSREVATPYRREMIMRARHLEQTALTSFLFAA